MPNCKVTIHKRDFPIRRASGTPSEALLAGVVVLYSPPRSLTVNTVKVINSTRANVQISVLYKLWFIPLKCVRLLLAELGSDGPREATSEKYPLA